MLPYHCLTHTHRYRRNLVAAAGAAASSKGSPPPTHPPSSHRPWSDVSCPRGNLRRREAYARLWQTPCLSGFSNWLEGLNLTLSGVVGPSLSLAPKFQPGLAGSVPHTIDTASLGPVTPRLVFSPMDRWDACVCRSGTTYSPQHARPPNFGSKFYSAVAGLISGGPRLESRHGDSMLMISLHPPMKTLP
jgi:hypothetical protein